MTATIPLIVTGLVGAGTVFFRGLGHYRLRVRAWPDRLEDLCRPRPCSRPVRLLVGLLSVLALVVAAWWPARGLHGTGPPWAAFAAGAMLAWACLMAAHWSYSPFLAVGGMAMVVLCLTALATGLAAAASPVPAADRVLAATLIALSFSGWLWMWLDRVWRQQRRDDQSSFTTTGELVGLASRFGVWLSVVACLAACTLVRFSLASSASLLAAASPGWAPTPTVPVFGAIALTLWLVSVLLGPFAEGGVRHRLLAAAEIAAAVLAYAIRS